MKITFVIGSLNIGGAEASMIRLANAMSMTHEVHLIYTQSENKLSIFIDKKINQIPLHSKKMRYAIGELGRTLRALSSDMVISTQTHVNIVVILSAILYKIPLETIVAREVCSPMKYLRPHKLATLLSGFLYPKIKAVVCVGEGLKNEVKQYFGLSENKVRAIYNGFDLDELNNRANEFLDHPFLHEQYNAVTTSRIVKGKGLEFLIEALAKTKNKVHVLVVGPIMDQSLYDSLQLRIVTLGIQDRIHFLGATHNPLAYVKRAGMFLLASESEGLPGSLVEALLLKKKCISRDCDFGPREILDGGRFGTLVPIHDIRAFALAIDEMCEAEVSFIDWENFITKFSMPYCVKQYENIMNTE